MSTYGVFEETPRTNNKIGRLSLIAVTGSAFCLVLLIAASYNDGPKNSNEDAVEKIFSNQKDLAAVHEMDKRISGEQLASNASNTSTSRLSDEEIKGFPSDMLAALNTSVDPCNDFYEFACGGWQESTTIPDWQSGWAKQWDGVTTMVENITMQLLQKDDGPAGRFYRSCMDTDTIQKLGSEPVKPWLRAVDEIKDHQSLMKALVQFAIADINVLWSWWVDADSTDSSAYSFFVAQGGIIMPDQTYYTGQTKEMEGHRAAYLTLVEGVLTLAGRTEEEAQQDAANTMEIETALAKVMTPLEAERDEHGEHLPLQALQAITPTIDWTYFFAGIGKSRVGLEGPYTDGRLLVKNVGFLKKMDEVLKSFGYDKLRSYFRWQAVYNYAPFLDFRIEDMLLTYNKEVYGISVLPPRWRKCFFSTNGAMGMAVSKLFVDAAFPRESRDAALEMLHEIKSRFNESLQHKVWMDEGTRIKAVGKLEHMFMEVGYPTVWPPSTFETFEEFGGIKENTYFDNCVATNAYDVKKTLNKLKTKVERRRWGQSSATDVNSYYSRKVNGIFIPAGILQPPFYSVSQAVARNYGSVGAICGHEISHGFDDVGREYDKDGNRLDWWTPQVVANFKERAQCISDLFSSYEFYGGNVNGKLTLGEAIADSGGLKFAWEAFLKSQNPSDDEKRTFFLAMGQTWCSKEQRKGARAALLTDQHPPNKYRVIGTLSQFKPFAEMYHCPVGTPMHPNKTCNLW